MHHRFHCHSNLVKDAPKASNQLLVIDITCLPIRQETAYLSVATDTFSRRIVGHRIHSNLHTTGYLAALNRTVRGVGRTAVPCVHHSDRGSQYTSNAYQTTLNQTQLRCSMTDGYDYYQTALAE